MQWLLRMQNQPLLALAMWGQGALKSVSPLVRTSPLPVSLENGTQLGVLPTTACILSCRSNMFSVRDWCLISSSACQPVSFVQLSRSCLSRTVKLWLEAPASQPTWQWLACFHHSSCLHDCCCIAGNHAGALSKSETSDVTSLKEPFSFARATRAEAWQPDCALDAASPSRSSQVVTAHHHAPAPARLNGSFHSPASHRVKAVFALRG